VCALAKKDGFNWRWIDSLCIEQASSSELQEAIDSMFGWYENAQLCYVLHTALRRLAPTPGHVLHTKCNARYKIDKDINSGICKS
jgi:hypothetical protein